MKTKVDEFIKELRGNIFKTYGVQLPNINIRYDLKGNTAGWFVVKAGIPSIRINTYLLEKYKDAYINQTVAHEYCHYAIYIIYQYEPLDNKPKPHGKEWKEVMREFGFEPKRCHEYEVELNPNVKHWDYKCSCTEYVLSTRRHNKIQKGYPVKCKVCGTRAEFVSEHII